MSIRLEPQGRLRMLSPNKRAVNKRFIIRSIGLAVILIRYYNTSVACIIYIAACLVRHELASNNLHWRACSTCSRGGRSSTHGGGNAGRYIGSSRQRWLVMDASQGGGRGSRRPCRAGWAGWAPRGRRTCRARHRPAPPPPRRPSRRRPCCPRTRTPGPRACPARTHVSSNGVIRCMISK